ncbi:MAG: hypothetical protein V7K47_30705 [Nostoc sp.]
MVAVRLDLGFTHCLHNPAAKIHYPLHERFSLTGSVVAFRRKATGTHYLTIKATIDPNGY